MALSIEEKYDEVRQLITMGKEKGYLLYEEVNDMLPSEISSSDELDDIFSMFGSMGIEVVESESKLRDKSENEEGLDLTPGALDKTNDPVRMYLREMGTVPLLTREGEVEIAKRIEAGKNAVMKAVTRNPITAVECAEHAERLGAGEMNVREVVIFNEEEITEEKTKRKIRETIGKLDKVAATHKAYLAYRKRVADVGKRSPRYVRSKWKLGRYRVAVSKAIRNIEFTAPVKRRMIERVREGVERLLVAGEKIRRLEPKLKHKISDEYKKVVRRQINEQREVIRGIEAEFDTKAAELRHTPRRDRDRRDPRRAGQEGAGRGEPCGWWSRSPRSTPTVACSSWT